MDWSTLMAHMYGMVISGVMFAAGIYFFFGLTGQSSFGYKAFGVLMSSLGGLLFLLTLIPAF